MVLNLILLAIPASAIGFAYVSMQIELRREADSFSDGPVVYNTEFVGFSGPVWPLLIYFLAPNFLMIAYLMRRIRRRNNTSTLPTART